MQPDGSLTSPQQPQLHPILSQIRPVYTVNITDELQKIQKQGFSEAFQKLRDRAKACI
jgi:hypothetical protein